MFNTKLSALLALTLAAFAIAAPSVSWNSSTLFLSTGLRWKPGPSPNILLERRWRLGPSLSIPPWFILSGSAWMPGPLLSTHQRERISMTCFISFLFEDISDYYNPITKLNPLRRMTPTE
ncbi:hypothetical protein B0H19DRAFT_1083930 [Mycena capillaripes]|nr:hypothetical protein B0H19DRAFT_1083930 [Mycena capillaripes]